MQPPAKSSEGKSGPFRLSPEQNTWAAACHEAAHAAVIHTAGGYVMRLSLNEQATHFAWPPARRRHSYVLMLLAGHIAGALIIPDCWAAPGIVAKVAAEVATKFLEGGPVLEGDPVPNADHDIWLTAQEALRLFPQDHQAAERYIGQSAAKAETIVRARWPLIEAIATSLLARGELSRPDFLAIIDEPT